ncbi:MAG: phosphatase [Helicobacteraceae bacterium]|jgi:exopolyphosphatase/guanosine-5'-triphosphate,3'-diphosphate pyrophosphatase|nr:phosphatase [Helicobacteraceae bacterium]
MIAIDLGSNTIRFLAADAAGNEIWERQFVARAAENLVFSGEICRAALERVAAAVEKARSEFDFTPHEIKAVATQAFREAKNRDEALRYLLEKTSINFEVISAETEAELTAIAAVRSAKNCGLEPPFFVLDIGGASSEIIYASDREVISHSLAIGIVVLSELGLGEDDLKKYLREEFKQLANFAKRAAMLEKPRTFIATAGAPTTIAAIKKGLTYENYSKKIVNGARLNRAEILKIYAEIAAKNQNERDILTGKDRADLVLTGAVMLLEFLAFFEFNECCAIDEALREGVLLRALNLA